MRQRLNGVFWLALAVLLVPMTAMAQPMADLTPDEAILYMGWRGANDMGDDYEGSLMQGMVEQTGLLDALPELLSAAESFAAEENAGDEEMMRVLESMSAIGQSAWSNGAAVYVLAPEDAVNGPPFPRIAFLFRRGGADEPELRAALADLVQMANEAEEIPMFMGVTGDALFLSIGFDAAELPDDNMLADAAPFQDALEQVQADAAMVLYLNGAEMIEQIDAFVAGLKEQAEEWGEEPDPSLELWPTMRDVTGLGGVNQLIMTAGIVERRWETRMFMDAPAPRTGILSLIDNDPIDADQLLHVPKTATFVQAGSVDPSRVLEVTRDILGAIDPGMVDELDNALEDASEEVGFDIERDLVNGIGPTWSVYIDPMIAGNNLASIVIVNELRDADAVATALMRLCNMGNDLLEDEMLDEPINIRFLSRQMGGESIVSLGVPFVSPSWMVHDGKLYFALYPQALEMALDQSGDADDSILANATFRETMARLGQTHVVGEPQAGSPAATAISFTDLPETAPDGYGMMLMIAQAIGGAAEMTTGEPATFQLPPIGKLMPFLEPAGQAAWIDEAGLHARAMEPFPGSSLLGPGKGMESSALVAAPMAVGVMLPAMGAARQSARRMQAHTQARGIGMGMIIYAEGNNDEAPDDIALLVQGNFVTPEYLVAPNSLRAQPIPFGFDDWEADRQMRFHRENSSFVLVPVGDMGEIDEPWNTLLLFQRPDDANGWGEGIVVVWGDGHTTWEHDVDWIDHMLEEQTDMTMDELIERQVGFEGDGE
ncbi:hypothetical protein OT109_10375 [Phycisphaeraceae bacterium D3-23]